ncbi:hypothetical protein [Ruegeria arenilitoris]|uniref:hypothetical protein n=1 Tax=Ruegeria arenilitoris TaxID=1173585 RepID=UPI00147A383D|nr:hypothetical protein [Ruegeria arenilitoris]
MNDLNIAPYERGVLRLFHLDMRPEEAKFLREPGAVDQVLGVTGLDAEQIDIFPVSDLEDLGLYGYLLDGCGISDDQLNREKLGAIEGWVLVVRSAAFRGREATLTLDPRVRLVGLFTEAVTNWSGGKIETESALPFSGHQILEQDTNPRRIGSAILAVAFVTVIGGLLWMIL